MLLETSLPSSIEAAFSFISDLRNQDSVYDTIPGVETRQKGPERDNHPKNGRGEAIQVIDKKNNDDSCMLNVPSCSQLSTVSTMSENSVRTLVYQRRRLQSNSAKASVNTKRSYDCISATSSEAPSTAAKEENTASLVELENEAVRAPVTSELVKRFSAGEKPTSEEARENETQKILDLRCVNDTCSSSKSNVELASAPTKTEVDDTGECSSSEALFTEALNDDLSEKDFCISILRNEGLLEGAWSIGAHASSESMGTRSERSGRLSCKTCGQSETTLKMLICDHCEEAFHISCCYTRVKKMPGDEWICQSCLKRTRKILKETTVGKSPNISSEMVRCRKETLRGELGPVAFMLDDTEPYRTGVRIGKEFQADIPNWSGPIINDVETVGEILDITPESVSLHQFNSCKPSRLSSIGNWVQCQEVIDGVGDGVDGTICGKWRRAPLFEVQTDDWECFRSVLWDPAHADCAVPQELDTEEVLKHLKYLELLKPRLAAKRRRLDSAKRVGSQKLMENGTSIQTQ